MNFIFDERKYNIVQMSKYVLGMSAKELIKKYGGTSKQWRRALGGVDMMYPCVITAILDARVFTIEFERDYPGVMPFDLIAERDLGVPLKSYGGPYNGFLSFSDESIVKACKLSGCSYRKLSKWANTFGNMFYGVQKTSGSNGAHDYAILIYRNYLVSTVNTDCSRFFARWL